MNLRKKPINELSDAECKSLLVGDKLRYRDISVGVRTDVLGSSMPSAQAVWGATVGERIDTLRLECGWSQDVLAKKTGLDKKNVQRHILNRAEPNPNTLKLYADAFNRELRRPINVADLLDKSRKSPKSPR